MAKNPTNNFKFKNFLFGATNIVENSDKEQYVYRGYRITFDSACFWSFGNGTTRNVIISNKWKNNFLILDKVPTFEINGSFGSPEK